MDTLTAADAIRLGSAMKKRQAFWKMLDGTDASCAYGAMLDGAGMLDRYMSLIINDGMPSSFETIQERLRIAATEVFARFPVLNILAECVCGRFRTSVGGLIAHLNDTHGWARGQIADWVEVQERLLVAIQTEVEFNAVATEAGATAAVVEPVVIVDNEFETVVVYG